jgi:hypothetical protein
MERSAKSTLRVLLLIGTGLTVMTVLVASIYNSSSQKYSIASAKAAADKQCPHQLFVLSQPDSLFCCDTALRHLDWACIAAFQDSFGKVITTLWVSESARSIQCSKRQLTAPVL